MIQDAREEPNDRLSPDAFAAWYRDVPPPPDGARGRLAQHLAAISADAGSVHPSVRRRRWPLSAWGLGSIAAAAVVVILALPSRPNGSSVPGVADAASPIRIKLHAPAAHEVALVGDFNDWSRETDRMRRDSEAGVWHTEVALRPGRHGYAFIVDGTRWTIDPRAPQSDLADFGVINVVLVASR